MASPVRNHPYQRQEENGEFELDSVFIPSKPAKLSTLRLQLVIYLASSSVPGPPRSSQLQRVYADLDRLRAEHAARGPMERASSAPPSVSALATIVEEDDNEVPEIQLDGLVVQAGDGHQLGNAPQQQQQQVEHEQEKENNNEEDASESGSESGDEEEEDDGLVRWDAPPTPDTQFTRPEEKCSK